MTGGGKLTWRTCDTASVAAAAAGRPRPAPRPRRLRPHSLGEEPSLLLALLAAPMRGVHRPAELRAVAPVLWPLRAVVPQGPDGGVVRCMTPRTVILAVPMSRGVSLA